MLSKWVGVFAQADDCRRSASGQCRMLMLASRGSRSRKAETPSPKFACRRACRPQPHQQSANSHVADRCVHQMVRCRDRLQFVQHRQHVSQRQRQREQQRTRIALRQSVGEILDRLPQIVLILSIDLMRNRSPQLAAIAGQHGIASRRTQVDGPALAGPPRVRQQRARLRRNQFQPYRRERRAQHAYCDTECLSRTSQIRLRRYVVWRGAGNNLKLAPVMTASVPWLPISSFIRSKPATFFTTRPPPLPLRPSPVTKRTPMQ